MYNLRIDQQPQTHSPQPLISILPIGLNFSKYIKVERFTFSSKAKILNIYITKFTVHPVLDSFDGGNSSSSCSPISSQNSLVHLFIYPGLLNSILGSFPSTLQFTNQHIP